MFFKKGNFTFFTSHILFLHGQFKVVVTLVQLDLTISFLPFLSDMMASNSSGLLKLDELYLGIVDGFTSNAL